MSLSAILRLLGSGEVGSVVNVLQAVVHAVIEEIEHLRGEHDQSTSACMAAMNVAEDRTRDLVGAAVMDLAKRVDAIEASFAVRVGDVQNIANGSVVRIREAYETRAQEIEATLRTHVERLEAAIEGKAPRVLPDATLAGYEVEGQE